MYLSLRSDLVGSLDYSTVVKLLFHKKYFEVGARNALILLVMAMIIIKLMETR
jgi:hypothetical protein